MEIEQVGCDCCGLIEDCTPDYISQVKEKFEGKWLCGLCSEAVRYEVSRSNSNDIATGDALRACMSFRDSVNSNPATRVADGMKLLLRRRSGELSSSPSSPSSSKLTRSVSAK